MYKKVNIKIICIISSFLLTKYDINGDAIAGKWWSPSIHDEMMYMFALTFIYIALAWYFAQIVGGDMGAAKKKLFCISYKYWACLSKKISTW